MKLVVIGAGSWGTAVSALAAHNAPVTLWSRRPEVAEAINARHENPSYLQGFPLPSEVHATADLTAAVTGAEAIVMGVPSHGFRSVLAAAAPAVSPQASIISLTKGIEQGTLMRMTEVISDVLPDHDRGRIGVLGGPNLAREIMAGQPAATVIAMRDENAARELQTQFLSPRFRVYTNTDVIGCEVAGACKNVMAIASGMASGLGFGDNTRAMLVTRALAELTRLGIALGGSPFTFGGLAGIGDLVATCYSEQSRNHTVGRGLGEGRSLDDVVAEMNMVAEGVKSTEGVLRLAEQNRVEMPIAIEVGRVLYEGANPRASLLALMTREAKPEGHGIVG